MSPALKAGRFFTTVPLGKAFWGENLQAKKLLRSRAHSLIILQEDNRGSYRARHTMESIPNNDPVSVPLFRWRSIERDQKVLDTYKTTETVSGT